MDTLFHVFNRGVDKREIFMDDRDRLRFVHDLFEFNDRHKVGNIGYFYNNAQAKNLVTSDVDRLNRRPRELLVNIHAFALMPNHYHLLISPVAENGISRFMQKLNMGYAKYFNEKYERSGTLFQGKYKSVPILKDGHFTSMPYYIHFNPLDLFDKRWRERALENQHGALEFLRSYRWSSHLDYLGEKNFPSVTQREMLLDYFGGTEGYKKSLKQTLADFSMEAIQNYALE